MELHLMREEPENSGKYVDVEGAVCNTAEEAVKLAVEKGGEGGRYAIRVYESLRSDVQRERDHTDAQMGAAAQRAAEAQRAAAAAPAPAPAPAPAAAPLAPPA